MLYAIVVTLHIIVSLFLILVVLLQTGKGGDLASAFGGGGTQTVFGPRGTSNVLTKATTIAAVIFMCTSLSLVFLTQGDRGSVLDEVDPAAVEETTGEPADETPALIAPEEPDEEAADDASQTDTGMPPQGN